MWWATPPPKFWIWCSAPPGSDLWSRWKGSSRRVPTGGQLLDLIVIRHRTGRSALLAVYAARARLSIPQPRRRRADQRHRTAAILPSPSRLLPRGARRTRRPSAYGWRRRPRRGLRVRDGRAWRAAPRAGVRAIAAVRSHGFLRRKERARVDNAIDRFRGHQLRRVYVFTARDLFAAAHGRTRSQARLRAAEARAEAAEARATAAEARAAAAERPLYASWPWVAAAEQHALRTIQLMAHRSETLLTQLTPLAARLTQSVAQRARLGQSTSDLSRAVRLYRSARWPSEFSRASWAASPRRCRRPPPAVGCRRRASGWRGCSATRSWQRCGVSSMRWPTARRCARAPRPRRRRGRADRGRRLRRAGDGRGVVQWRR